MRKILFLSILLTSVLSCKKSVEDLKILTPTTLSFSKAEESTNISITAYSDWTAQCDADWVTLYPAQGTGGGDGMSSYIKLTVAENTGYDDRTCTVSIISNGKTFTVTVNQTKNTGIILSETEQDVDYTSQSLKVEGKANIPVQVVISSSSSWITRAETKGLSGFSYSFAVAENSGKESREGKVIFKNTDTGDEETLVIRQEGKPKILFCETPGIYKGEEMLAGFVEFDTQLGLFEKSGQKEFHIVNVGAGKFCLFIGVPDVSSGSLPEPFPLSVKQNMMTGYDSEMEMTVKAYKYEDGLLWGEDKVAGLGVILLTE